MNNQNNVNETLKSVFSNAGLVDVLCSIYENNLTSIEIAKRLDLDFLTVEKHLNLLLDLKLIKKYSRNSTDSYIAADPKVCDSILMLKDALYHLAATTNL